MATVEALEVADRLLDVLLGLRPRGEFGGVAGLHLAEIRTGDAILEADRHVRAAIVTSALERLRVPIPGWRRNGPGPPIAQDRDVIGHDARGLLILVIQTLLRRKLPLTEPQVRALLEHAAGLGRESMEYWGILPGVLQAVSQRSETEGLSEPLREAMRRLVATLRKKAEIPEYRQGADRLSALLLEVPHLVLEPGEAWSDAALADLAAMPSDRRLPWDRLLAHCQSASSKPTAAWLRSAEERVEEVGYHDFKQQVLRWFPLVDRPRTAPIEQHPRLPEASLLIQPPHVELLKGLAWCSSLRADRDLARALAALAQSAYRKIPRKGPRLVMLGNACVAALGRMTCTDSVGALAMLKVKVKFGTAQKEVEKALTNAAAREGIPRDEIEELGVPAYGLEEVGRRRETFGEYTAELVVDGNEVEARWSRADGKALKSVPAAVKKEHAEALKELQGVAKDAARMLGAQRERLDGLYLARKSWPYQVWRERYLDHPLVGTIARRLIWSFNDEGVRAGIAPDGRPIDRDGAPLPGLGPETTVALWHPIDHPTDDVLAWRGRLEELGIRQPFKQAHREIYVLTDAERATATYSNRFAGHILRQHQFHALCQGRGWRDALRLIVDDEVPPPATRALPEWGLRAEYWVGGAGDTYGQDTNELGTYHRLATDQVRFYELHAAAITAHGLNGGHRADSLPGDARPLPLEQVPALVFSEVMRDVDLFVGVASIVNDPTWSDGGPDGRHVEYWTHFSFGDLSATGRTRKAALERIIPHLKIAGRCSFVDRFLVVRGDRRTYRIHLGSGNIRMDPNDQYLCIVANRGAGAIAEGLFLPFDGDLTLSVILSKAFLLADDTRIKDPYINSQIDR